MWKRKQQTTTTKKTHGYHNGEVLVPECHKPQLLEIDTERSVLNKINPPPKEEKQRNKRKLTHPTLDVNKRLAGEGGGQTNS